MKLKQLIYLLFVTLCALMLGKAIIKCKPESCPESQKYELRVSQRPQQGDQRLYSVEAKFDIKQGMDPSNKEHWFSMGLEMLLGARIEIQKVSPEGELQAQATVEQIKFAIRSLMGNFVFDTDGQMENIPPVWQPLATLKGQSVIFDVAATGHLKAVKGAGEAVESVLAKLEDLAPETRTQVVQDVNEGVERMVASHFRIFNGNNDMLPDHPVAIGETWTTTQEMDNQGQRYVVESTYTLKAVHEQAYDLGFSGVIRPIVSPVESQQTTGMTMTFHGDFQLNRANDWLQSGQTDLTAELSFPVIFDNPSALPGVGSEYHLELQGKVISTVKKL